MSAVVSADTVCDFSSVAQNPSPLMQAKEETFSGEIPAAPSRDEFTARDVDFEIPAGTEAEIQILTNSSGRLYPLFWVKFDESLGFQPVTYDKKDEESSELADGTIETRILIILSAPPDRQLPVRVRMQNHSQKILSYNIHYNASPQGDAGQNRDAGNTPESALQVAPNTIINGILASGGKGHNDGDDLYSIGEWPKGAVINLQLLDVEGRYDYGYGISASIEQLICKEDGSFFAWDICRTELEADAPEGTQATLECAVKSSGHHLIHITRQRGGWYNRLGGGAHLYKVKLGTDIPPPTEPEILEVVVIEKQLARHDGVPDYHYPFRDGREIGHTF